MHFRIRETPSLQKCETAHTSIRHLKPETDEPLHFGVYRERAYSYSKVSVLPVFCDDFEFPRF